MTLDTDKTLWHKEDELNILDFATYEGEVYALTEDCKVIALNGAVGTVEGDFDWELISGDIGYLTPFYKRIVKLTLRLFMARTTTASISIQYDSSGAWEHVTMLRPSGKIGSIAIPIMPHRCDHFSLKISGKGDFKLLSIAKYTEEGSDVR